MSNSSSENYMGSWDVCSLDDIINIDNPFAEKKKELESANCPVCHITLSKLHSEYSLDCKTCGYMEVVSKSETLGMQSGDNHNVSSNSYMSFKPVGGGKNHLYTNTMIKYTSEAAVYKDNQVLDKIVRYNFINNELNLPQSILDSACELFITIKNSVVEGNYVRRGKSLRGVLGAGVYVECQRAGITKTKAQIAKMMQVDESHITNGYDELVYFDSKGVILLPKNKDPSEDFFNELFEIFEIPIRYKQFALDLLERMIVKNIKEVQNCQNFSKCIGIVYFMGLHFKFKNITHENISINYNKIARSTYLNITKAVQSNFGILEKTFKKHNLSIIPTLEKN